MLDGRLPVALSEHVSQAPAAAATKQEQDEDAGERVDAFPGHPRIQDTAATAILVVKLCERNSDSIWKHETFVILIPSMRFPGTS